MLLLPVAVPPTVALTVRLPYMIVRLKERVPDVFEVLPFQHVISHVSLDGTAKRMVLLKFVLFAA